MDVVDFINSIYNFINSLIKILDKLLPMLKNYLSEYDLYYELGLLLDILKNIQEVLNVFFIFI